MKTLFIIFISGTLGMALGWFLCAVLSAGKRTDECMTCLMSRMALERK